MKTKNKKITKRPKIHDVWRLPFRTDDWDPYIWSANDTMAFMWAMRSPEVRADIVRVLNGEPWRKPNTVVRAELRRGCSVVLVNQETGDEYLLGIVRGWGNLHGIGGLNLEVSVAEQVHEEFCQWFVNTINGD